MPKKNTLPTRALPALKASVNDVPLMPEALKPVAAPTSGLDAPDKKAASPIQLVHPWEGRLPPLPPPMRLITRYMYYPHQVILCEPANVKMWKINDPASLALLEQHWLRKDGAPGELRYMIEPLLVRLEPAEDDFHKLIHVEFRDSYTEIDAIIGFWFADHPEYAFTKPHERITADAIYPFCTTGDGVNCIGRWAVERVRQYFATVSEKRLKYLAQKSYKTVEGERDLQVIKNIRSHAYYDAMNLEYPDA